VSALTPDCDPDLSNCGSPARGPDRGGPGLRSTLVVLAVLAGSVLVATGESVPGALSVLAGGVALLAAVSLVRRVVRLVRRAVPAAVAHGHWVPAVRPSRPAG
jgi:hypothetical protein